jgi:hypothetical protein
MSTKAKDRKVKGKKAKTTAIKATTASARKVKNGDFASLVEAKKTKLHEAMADTRIAELKVEEPPDLRMAGALYDRFAVGELQNLERNRVRWIPPGPTWTGPDLFEFIPKADRPFTFIRHRGQQISPHNMITDIGSIPRLAGLFSRGLTPWGYAAAYLVHDWEFELHHCGGTTKTFDQVRDTMMECVKTLMEKSLAPKSQWNFWLLYQGINSALAHRYWDRDPPSCTLPPYDPEA